MKTIEMDSGRVFHQTERDDRTCHLHGEYEAYLFELKDSKAPKELREHWTNCPDCDAIYQDDADKAHKVASGMTDQEARRIEKLQAAGIPARFTDATLWNWEHGMPQQDLVHRFAKGFVHEFANDLTEGRSCAFLGHPGTGKTHLAIGILREILKLHTGRYMSVMDMLGRIKDTYNQNATETEKQVVDHFAGVDLLVVDEVGKTLDTNYEVTQFFRIIDKRYQARKSTILVSNLDAQSFKDFLGEAVVDRLRENGGKFLNFDWSSYRKKAKARKKPELQVLQGGKA